jgi:hypothetical protein
MAMEGYFSYGGEGNRFSGSTITLFDLEVNPFFIITLHRI